MNLNAYPTIQQPRVILQIFVQSSYNDRAFLVAQLLKELVDVVVVNMAVAAGPDVLRQCSYQIEGCNGTFHLESTRFTPVYG